MTPGPDYYDHWRELASETWGEPPVVAYALDEGLEALAEYANEGPHGYDALEAIEAATEAFRFASLEILGEVE